MQTEQQKEILAAFCLIGDREKGKTLFSFASVEDQAFLNEVGDRLIHEDKKSLLQRMTQSSRLRKGSLLDEIHPGWILDKLEGESPRVIGLLCRLLSGEKVRTLLSDKRAVGLPKMKETYKISEEIAEIVRNQVEKRLGLASPSSSDRSFSFEHISLLKSDDLRTLFRDLGLEEIRKCFYNVEPAVLRAFLSRFLPTDAQEIRDRIERGGVVSLSEKEEAQKFITSLRLGSLSAEGLFREIGYAVFSKAIFSKEVRWVEGICYKLSPEEGYRLKKVFHELGGLDPVEEIQKRREAILGRLFLLAERGKTRRYWKGKGFKESR